MSLPSREECEAWNPMQLAYFLYQNNMQECAEIVSNMRIDGQRLLKLHAGDMSMFSLVYQLQLHKMVQDIKKNDGSSLLDKLRSRLKSNPRPKVPARDYQGDGVDSDEQWSETEFEDDCDIYEDPLEDQGDYEPPPSHKAFTPTPSNSFHRGEYVDSCRHKPSQPPRQPPSQPPGHPPRQLPRKPLRLTKAAKPPPSASRPMDDDDDGDDDDDDYVNPDSDGSYIRQREKPPPNHLMQGRTWAVKTSPLASQRVTERQHSPDVYEVPDQEDNFLPVNRAPSQALPPRVPRMKPSMPVQQPSEDDDDDNDYEVCHPDDGQSTKSEEDLRVLPTPRPRDKSPTPAFRPRPDLKHKEPEGPAVPTRHSSQKPSATLPFMDFKRPKIPLPQLFTSHRQAPRGSSPAENGSPDTEKEADLSQKPWYASACDRKTAEDTLIRSDKDGSFLVRESSGQNTRQPYTLVVLYNNRVYNIPVRYVPASQQYALGREKQGEERFSSVSRIIENHQWNPLVLIDSQSNNKEATKLCYPVRP